LIQPGGVSAFFEDHFDFTAQTAKEIAEVFGLSFNLRPALDVVGRIENDNHGNTFVDIHAHILDTIHRTPPCCWKSWLSLFKITISGASFHITWGSYAARA
jgi:hypothetical protein